MPADPRQIERIVRSVGDEQSFIQNLLIDGLHWDIPPEAKDLGKITSDWTPEKLQVAVLESNTPEGVINQNLPPNAQVLFSALPLIGTRNSPQAPF